jgi:hypothetical protein
MALGLLGVAAIVLAALVGRRWIEDSMTRLRMIRAGAAVYGVILTAVTTGAVIAQLTSDVIEVALPTEPFWPVLPAGVEAVRTGGATVVGGGFTDALVSVAGVSMGARVMLAAGSLAQGVTLLAVTAAVYLLAQRMLAGEPFRPMLSRAVLGAAVALVVGGVVWQLCFGIGQSMAAQEALTITGWDWNESLGLDDPSVLMPVPRVLVTVEFWPIFTGMALAAVAAAFRHGEQLQSDTDGLI